MISSYIEYFRVLASSHREIKDFKYLDVDMLISADNSGDLQCPVLMLDTLKGSLGGINSDSRLQKWDGGFVVLYRVGIDNFEEEKDVLEKSLSVGLDIIDRMNTDQESSQCFFCGGFDLSSVKWELFGPIGSNLYGVAFDFTLWLNNANRESESVWQF